MKQTMTTSRKKSDKFTNGGTIQYVPNTEPILTRDNFIVGRCPDCQMGPTICLERRRNHAPLGVCIEAVCLGCGFEGSITDAEFEG